MAVPLCQVGKAGGKDPEQPRRTLPSAYGQRAEGFASILTECRPWSPSDIRSGPSAGHRLRRHRRGLPRGYGPMIQAAAGSGATHRPQVSWPMQCPFCANSQRAYSTVRSILQHLNHVHILRDTTRNQSSSTASTLSQPGLVATVVLGDAGGSSPAPLHTVAGDTSAAPPPNTSPPWAAPPQGLPRRALHPSTPSTPSCLPCPH